MAIASFLTSLQTTWTEIDTTLSQALTPYLTSPLASEPTSATDVYLQAAAQAPLGTALIGLGAFGATAFFLDRRQGPDFARSSFGESFRQHTLMLASLTASAAAMSVFWTMPDMSVLTAGLSFGALCLATMACEKPL